MTIDQNKGPGGVDASYGRRTTTTKFDTTKKHSTTVYAREDGMLVDPSGSPISTGGGVSGVPGQYLSTQIVGPGESLQDAIDAAPSSESLIRTLTTATSIGGNTYTFSSPTKPTKVFIDADELAERPVEFDPTTKQFSGTMGSSAFIWMWDSSTNRVVVYNKGNAVTAITVADYVAILMTGPKYDAVDLRPGIYLHGISPSFTEIIATTSKVDTGIPPGIEYTLRMASYCGVVGTKITRNGRITSGLDVCGVLFPLDRICDQSYFVNCLVEMDSTFSRYIDASAYRVGMFFGCGESDGGRAKNVFFISTPCRSFAQADLFETYSGTFFGLVHFIDSPIHGCFYTDGAKQTFKFINSPVDNQNTPSGPPRPIQEFSPLAFNVSGPGGQAAYPGETYYLEFINSPIRALRTDDPDIAGDQFRAFGWDGRVGLKFENSPISAEVGLLKNTDAGYSAVEAARLFARGSSIPPLLMTGLSAAALTPRVPQVYTSNTVNSVGTNTLGFGHFSMTYEDLKQRRNAIIQVRGTFANTANTKSVTVSHGVVGSLSLVKTSTGAYQNNAFTINVLVSFENDVVFVTVTQVSDAALSVQGVFKQALTAGQSYGLSLGATGVANGDISITSQQITLGA